MLSHPKGHKCAFFLLIFLLSITLIYNWIVEKDLRNETNHLKRSEIDAMLPATENAQGGFLGGKNPELLARMLAMPNLVRLAQKMM